MLVRKYSVISIFKDMWRNKVLTICIIIVCMLLGALLGYMTYQKESKEAQDIKDQINSESVEGEDEYITQLRNYEESMKACEEAYALAVEQRDTLKAYADSSIIMKIDPTDVKVAYCAYVISDTNNTANILSALHAYIYDGGLKEDATNNGGEDLEIEGWKDVVSAGTAGNNLFIAVNHYDADKAKEIMDVIQKCVEDETSVLSKTQGDYTISLTSESYYAKEDINIVNTQNGINQNLKLYQDSVSDQLNRINNLQTAIDTFKEKSGNKESSSIKNCLAKTIVLYSIAGVILGFLLCFIVFVVKVSASNVIQCSEHLQYSGLTVINIYKKSKKSFTSKIEDTISELERIVANKDKKAICIFPLTDSDTNTNVATLIGDRLANKDGCNSNLFACSDVVIVLTSGKDTYSDLEAILSRIDRMGIGLLGIVVCE